MTTGVQEIHDTRPAFPLRRKRTWTNRRGAPIARRLCLVALGVLFMASAYLLSLNSPFGLYERSLALVVVWLGSLPTFIYLLDARRPQIPFFPLVGLFYASNFGLPLFAADKQGDSDADLLRIEDVTAESLWYTIAGMVCLLVAFYAGSALARRRIKAPHIPGNYLSARFQTVLWGFLLVYFAYRNAPFLKTIPSVGHLINPLGYLGFGFLFYLSLNGRLSTWKSCLLWLVFVPLEIMFRLSSGSIAETMIFALFFSLIALRSAPKLALAAFALAIALLAIFNPVKGIFRMITWYTIETTPGPQLAYAKCVLLIRLAYDYHFGSTANMLAYYGLQTSTVSSVANRLSSMTVLSLVVDKTPAAVPYWKGESYLPLLTKVIPRALWPGKPVDDMGNEFGHRYFLLEDADEATSINLPWIVELFANFGALGILLGMGLIGLGLAWLDRVFNPLKNTPVELIIGATLLLQLIYQESSFSLMVGDALLLYIVLRIAMKVAFPASARVKSALNDVRRPMVGASR